jgi:hypothetical protein
MSLKTEKISDMKARMYWSSLLLGLGYEVVDVDDGDGVFM